MSNALTFFISERNSIVVVSFVGDFTRSSLGTFPKVIEDVSGRRARMVILNCHDLNAIESCAVKPFAELQAFLRDIPSDLRICFLNPSLRTMLTRENALRESELKNNLLEAVGSFLGHAKKAA